MGEGIRLEERKRDRKRRQDRRAERKGEKRIVKGGSGKAKSGKICNWDEKK